MFNFMKKEKKKRLTPEELLRLDEVRAKMRSNKAPRPKLGITADYSADFLAALNQPPPPKPPKRRGGPRGPPPPPPSKADWPLPEAPPPVLPTPRHLVIRRQPSGDFGFSLRRAVSAGRRTVILAEPGAKGHDSGLLPGDRLVAVNGERVDDKTRDEVIQLIRSSGHAVTVTVQPVPELVELSNRENSRRLLQARRGNEASWDWLVHRHGYTKVTRLPPTTPDSSAVRVIIQATGQEATVDEDDVEKANSPDFDLAEELSGLPFLNEAAALHVIRMRAAAHLHHIRAGPALLIVNPQGPLAAYSDKLASHFRGISGQEWPPHVYGAAQAAYRTLLASRRDQALIFMGRSGAGKSTSLRHALQFLAWTAAGGQLTADRLIAAASVVEAFCTAKSGTSTSATKVSCLFSLDVDQSGQVASANVQLLLAEKTRIAASSANDLAFHVLYRLLLGAEGPLRRELSLDALIALPNILVDPSAAPEERPRATADFNRLSAALTALGVTEVEANSLWTVLAAILHLGAAGEATTRFLRPQSAQTAAQLLGLSLEDLQRTLFAAPCLGPVTQAAAGLYGQVLHAVATLINRGLSRQTNTSATLLLLDAPGLQTSGSQGWSGLCHNYLAERLHLLWHETAIQGPMQLYDNEEVTVDIDEEADATGVANLLETAVFGQLEEAATSEATVIERLTKETDKDGRRMAWSTGANEVTINHLHGTCSVAYDTSQWLAQAKESQLTRVSGTLLQDSNKETIRQMSSFAKCSAGPASTLLPGGLMDGTLTVRRTRPGRLNSVRTMLAQSDVLIETLRRARPRFIVCLVAKDLQDSDDIDVALLRSQLRGSQVLPAARLYKQGFPDNVPLAEFRRQFGLLGLVERPTSPMGSDGERQAVQETLTAIEWLEESQWRIGLTKVFFRSGVLGQLEAQRDEKLQDHVTRLQARCKGYLARRRFEKRKVQEVAVRCVQRNVRRFLKVRDWPWWRLLVRVAPLLNVHRAEEELRKQTEELEGMRVRLDKSEAEKLRLKQHNERLEARMNELTVALAEEQSAAHLAAERLEAESAERSRLQHELQNAQEKQSSLREASQRLEMEILMCRASDDASHTSGEDEDGGYEHLKQRLDRAVKEAAALRRQLQQQQEAHEDQLMALRKASEKRVADALEEVEEQRQVVAQMKRKAQRVTGEHNDTRLMLEEQSARNTILEKRQKKFDSEMHQLQEAVRQEKSSKEKALRERDLMAAEKTSAEQNLAACRLELEMRDEKVAALGRELEELAFGGAAEEEVAALRKSKHALERRVKEQEEELDELAGQVGLLEAAKVRLEMSLEQQRKEAKREASQRDDEMEEIRGNAQKKVRALESQLEAEHEERTRLLREKHDLDRRLAEAAEVARGRAPEDEQMIQRLRRELRHAKALLRDAHGLLERQRDETGGRGQLRALRHQLEDAEAARAVAMKARQTAESEARELQAALEEEKRGRALAEDKAAAAVRSKTEVVGQLEENEEELAEVLKKYRASVAQISIEQAATTELAATAAALEAERNSLREQVAEMSARLEAAEGETTIGLTARRLETKIRELESRLELEATTRARAETQCGRFREQAEKVAVEAEAARARETAANDAARRAARQLREAREREASVAAKEAEAIRKRKELEMRVETCEAEAATARADLRLALQRIEDLQAAMAGDSEDLGSESSGSIESLLDSVGGSQEFLDFACRSPEGQSDPGDGVGHLTDSKDESHA
ncbi:unconventional myosin-XVIIIa isoform X3 [Neocloeon triangulifer]|uniref:unconventional myosin-XVIIIa isoform X3 n=1 Tax=Neocloeon triangulifer TaxID=2078957 RepID=UPI00286ED043|nr:unconventional myosin-XVIIIa isoform X3 [Neocloeon triangulifer]